MLDFLRLRSRSGTYRLAVLLYLFVAVFSGLGLLGKASLITHLLPVPRVLVYPAVLIFILLPLGWPLALRARRFVAPFVCLGILCASVLIYPRMQALQQRTGRGSDQPDCVIVAAKGMAAAEWPYDTAKLWTHDPMSCGPGWVLMQTPAIVTVGYRWNLVALWLVALLLLRSVLAYEAVAGLLTLVGLSAVTWVTASDGSDFLPFGILLAALFLVVQRSSRFSVVVLVLVTLVIQFRFPMLILPILFFPYRRIREAVIVSCVAFCFQIFFLLWQPQAYIAGGPLHLLYKLTHTHLLAVSRWSATMEVSAVFALMVSAALLVRRFIKSPWIAFAYVLALTVLPAISDLVHKRHEFGSLLSAFGIWEGANWMSGCLPLAALFLLLSASRSNKAFAPALGMAADEASMPPFSAVGTEA